jgi:hypothetical protein
LYQLYVRSIENLVIFTFAVLARPYQNPTFLYILRPSTFILILDTSVLRHYHSIHGAVQLLGFKFFHTYLLFLCPVVRASLKRVLGISGRVIESVCRERKTRDGKYEKSVTCIFSCMKTDGVWLDDGSIVFPTLLSAWIVF